MKMIDKIHTILKDPKCAGNIKCFMWASVVVCLYFGSMCASFALFDLSTSIQKIAQFASKIENLKEEIFLHKGTIHYGR